MHILIHFFRIQRYKFAVASALLFVISFVLVGHAYANDGTGAPGGRLVTFYDRGAKRIILTHAQTVRDAAHDANITISHQDTVEPDMNSKLVASDYVVNVYRARPVIIVDGHVRQKVMTAAQTASDIVAATDITTLRNEDKTKLRASGDIVTDGASVVLTIDRATAFTLQLYGKPIAAYSHADTVGEMLRQKGIKLSPRDSVSVGLSTPLIAGMNVAVWREGVQTATVEEPIAFPVRQVLDADQPIGYHVVQTPGTNGSKNVTYEITARSGRETSRKVIQSVAIIEPKEQIEIVGAKPGNGLTKSKGAQQFTDSRGVTHRETYYDLPMNIVMGGCGGGGYTIRAADGAKVDKDGYVLVAANYGNYPRCSIVETSMGPGKIYDTGGFAARHPHGFDLATDWTNNDGR